MKKYIVMGVLAIVVLFAGYFVFGQYAKNLEAEGDAPMPQGKINIDAVCESALAYMTFPNGAESDKFVAECKEGKHPEVIERYLKELNAGDGRAI